VNKEFKWVSLFLDESLIIHVMNIHVHVIFVNLYDINNPEVNCCVGPMMRPQQQQQQALHGGGGNMYLGGPTGVMQHQHRMAGTYVTPGGRNNQRPPNVSIGPDGINIGGRGSAEWRHLLLSQQQSAVFGTQMRPAFTQGGHQGKLSSDCLNCSHFVALLRHVVVVVYISVSQPPGRGLVPGPGINYTGPREVLLEFVVLVFQAFFMNKYFIVEIF